YGGVILSDDIQDNANNVTRFFALGHEDHERTGDDKTSLCFAFTEDRPGSLVEVLREWSDRGINLAKIESRPSKESLGKYIFLVDLEGHRTDPPVAASLEAVQAMSDPARFKVFGSYPRFKGAGG
ncbi:MAG: ACT domain-containing protein, partial [Chloroflexi bacterium]|nr:ACT domain-containing protein [Chloroflexota bacterium]